VNRFFTTDEVYKDRLAICKSCKHYFELTGQCGICLCFMKIKARLSHLSCPKKYWNKTTDIEIPDTLPNEIIEEIKNIYPDIKTGKAKDVETKKKMIELYNTIFNTNYDQGTNCRTCLNSVRKGITQLYKQYE
tara:strand:+ start:702 stop:1100 length:399 start_codon:yes stop_codon:yes gene_type:complete